jgi:hypothetical protein
MIPAIARVGRCFFGEGKIVGCIPYPAKIRSLFLVFVSRANPETFARQGFQFFSLCLLPKPGSEMLLFN